MLALRFFSACGLVLSGYLLFQKLIGKITYLVGCGAGSGCENVLGSKWSQWFLIPVTAMSLALYATLLVLTFKPQRTLLAAIATSLASAAVWFAIVQAVILKHFCPWCLSAHIIGLLCAGLIFSSMWRLAPLAGPALSGGGPPAKDNPGAKAKGATDPYAAPQAASRPPVSGALLPGILSGLAAIAILILGQVYGPAPATHAETNVVYTPTPAPAPPAGGAGTSTPAAATGPVHSRGEGRKVTFLVAKEYNVDALPHIGDAKAPNVVVKYYDYACDSCRDLHEDLTAFMDKHPGKLCVILLPCPINRACNPNVPSHIANHEHACELARLALACWRTDPESFPAVHHALFARPVMDQAQAMEAVKPLMKKPLAADALSDPWIDEILQADAEDYKRVNTTNAGSTNYLMPKLLVGGTRMLHGVTQTREILFKALESEFKL